MTIAELIKQLQEYDDRHEIMVEVVNDDNDDDYSYVDIKGIDSDEDGLFIELEY